MVVSEIGVAAEFSFLTKRSSMTYPFKQIRSYPWPVAGSPKASVTKKGFFDWGARQECSAHGLWDCLRGGVTQFGTAELTLLPFVAALSRSPGLRRCARLTASSNTNDQ